MDEESKIWDCIEYLEAEGYLIRPDVEPDQYVKPRHLPFALYPATMKSSTMSLITENQEIFNRLILNAVTDQEYMKSVMAPIAENDEFWRKLYNIWLKTADINRDEIKLGLFRVDYMLERDENGNETPFLVEFNTIASGAGALCCGVTKMHHALDIKPYNITDSEQYKNNALDNVLALGLADGVRQYSKRHKKDLSQLCVIIICEEKRSANFCDQNKIIRATQEALNFKTHVTKISFSNFRKIANFEENRIQFQGREVALVYYRSGYDPSCYKDDDSWKVREEIEMSRAVKCPSIDIHLATNKVFQASFANKENVLKYISEDEFNQLRRTFPETGPLSDWNSEIVKNALKSPQNYCLKILREGGAAGNLFGDEIISKMAEMEENESEKLKYILMRYLKPTVSPNVLVINGNVTKVDSVTEYSTFGGILSDNHQIIHSTNDGQLIRTKRSDLTSGGLMNGAATINSLHVTP